MTSGGEGPDDLLPGIPGSGLRAWASLTSTLAEAGFKYRRRIHPGGSSTVIEAERISDGKWVALKLAGGDGDAKAMLEREGAVLASLRHPSIIEILGSGSLYDANRSRSYLYLVIELGDVDLYKHVTDCERNVVDKEAASLVAAIGDALAYAHRREPAVLHLDVKPENIIRVAGSWKLADFNIARTGVNRGWGTEGFRSPQLGRSKFNEPGPEDDVYGLAATLYFILTRRSPHRPRLLQGFLPASPGRLAPNISPGIDRIVLAGLHPDRAWRYRSVEAFTEDLRRFLAGGHIEAPTEPWTSRVGRPLRWNAKKLATFGMLAAIGGSVIVGERGVALERAKTARVTVDADHNAKLARESARLADRRRRERDENAEIARRNAEEAAAVRRNKLEATYFDDMHRAWVAWRNDDVTIAKSIVAAYELPSSPQTRYLRGFEWHYLKRLLASGTHVIDFGEAIRATCFSPDGSSIAVLGLASKDIVPISYYRIADGSKQWDKILFEGNVRNDVFLNSKTVSNSQSLAFSPDGRFVAATCRLTPRGKDWAGHVKVWDVATGHEVRSITDERIAGEAVAFSPDGESIVAGGIWKSLVTCKINDTSQLKVYCSERNGLPEIARGWETVYTDATNNLLFINDGTSIRFTNFSRQGASPRNWSKVIAWPPANTHEGLDTSFKSPVNDFARIIAISPNGRRVLTQNEGTGLVRSVLLPRPELASNDTGRSHSNFPPADESSRDVVAIGDSKIWNASVGNRNFAAANIKGQKTFGTFDSGSGRILNRMQILGHDGEVGSVTLAPDECHLAIAGGHKVTIVDIYSEYSRTPLASVANQKFLGSMNDLLLRRGSASRMYTKNLLLDEWSLCQSTDRRWTARAEPKFARSSRQGIPYICLTSNGTSGSGSTAKRFPSPVKRVFAIAINLDASECAISGDDEEENSDILRSITQFGGRQAPPSQNEINQRPLIHIIDTATGAKKRVIRGGPGAVRWLSYLKDGKSVASSCINDRVIRIWNSWDNTPVWEFDLGFPVSSSEITPDGDELLVGCFGGPVKVWSIDSKRPLVQYVCKETPVWASRGRFVAILENGSKIQIWDRRKEERINTIDCGGRIVTDLAFLDDGSRLLSRDAASTVMLWSVALAREICRLPYDEPSSDDFLRFVEGLAFLQEQWKEVDNYDRRDQNSDVSRTLRKP